MKQLGSVLSSFNIILGTLVTNIAFFFALACVIQKPPVYHEDMVDTTENHNVVEDAEELT